MPETIRTANGRLRSRPRRGGILVAFVIANLALILGTPATAGATIPYAVAAQQALAEAGRANLATLSLTLGLICFGVLATIALLRTRRRADRIATSSRNEVMDLHAEIDRLKALLLSEPQVLVEWRAGADSPEIFGDTALFIPGAPAGARARLRYLAGAGDGAAPGACGGNAARRRPRFHHDARPARPGGRPKPRAVLWPVARCCGCAMSAASSRNWSISPAVTIGWPPTSSTLTTLLDSLPAPVWARDESGRLIFVNAAYARAVEAADAADAVARDLELLDHAAREQVAQARAEAKPYAARLPAIVAGTRRIFDVVDAPSHNGSAGMAIDRTEAEAMRAELARMIEAHRRVLDQLATGVAIFNVDRKLTFYNTAFRSLFELDASFLDQTPTDASVLDTLRTGRKLPEEQDFRLWKQQLYEAYTAVEPKEHMWHLPDGRTLRVVTTPNPEGGVTYLYDDVTERLDLHRRYDALDQGAGRDARSSRRSGGGVRLGRPRAPA